MCPDFLKKIDVEGFPLMEGFLLVPPMLSGCFFFLKGWEANRVTVNMEMKGLAKIHSLRLL